MSGSRSKDRGTGWALLLWIVVVAVLGSLLSGCSTVQQPEPTQRTEIAQIPDMKQVEIPKLEPAIKPNLIVTKTVEGTVVTLDQKGMRQLIDLYKHDGYATATSNATVDVARAAINERNRLLALAKAEEVEGNRLRAELHNVKEARESERTWGSIELNATRALLLLSILAGM